MGLIFKEKEKISNIEITQEEYTRLKKIETIVLHSLAAKPGVFFICGKGGEEDAMGYRRIFSFVHPWDLMGWLFIQKLGNTLLLDIN